ncbi:alpha/beta fold hydrolase [Ruicaihuangia caeni]|uniref:Alpha/beta hydrolase n=1 Tax=Ruicaihuangia caeni TaxID=3042517 RepID=A0AAW6T3Y6_9MICO|nr:alpha/beta hydrolase [Klugiella sp. YN-L-19]MDI2098159.1 alpha/beta hydrolase [Klugiella sp. YN-L-19]
MSVPSPYAAALATLPVLRGEAMVRGARTAYWQYGDEDAAISVVFVHGFRGDHHGLEPIVAGLAPSIRAGRLRVVIPDLPGFGESQPFQDGRHDIAGYAAWLRAFVAEAGAGGSPVLGHSFGSIVVAAAAADGLGASRLMLVNPIAAPALEGPNGVLTRLAVLYYRVAAALPERLGFALLRNRLIVRVMSIAMVTRRDPVLRRFVHNQHDRYFSAFGDRAVVLEAFKASVSHDVREFADKIAAPTLLIAADRDQITPLPKQHTLARLFAEPRLAVVHGVGHLIHYEAPQLAAGEIASFLGLESHTEPERMAEG